MTEKKVLIADDERSILLAGKMFFERNGYNTIIVDDGEKAVAAVKKEKPEFALIDAIMPVKNGFEACKEIKENSETKDTVVIVFSGNVPEIEIGFDYGADDCIIKPLDWDKLIERMEKLVKGDEENISNNK